MKKILVTAATATLIFLPFFSTQVVADQQNLDGRTLAKLNAALDSSIRSDDDRERDESRKPIETLTFFGLKDDMRVLELVPGAGWYTKILAPVLETKGEHYLAVRVDEDRLKLADIGLDHVQIIGSGYDFAGTDQRGVYDVAKGDLGVSDLDMVLTFRNLHNLTESSRAALNKDIFNSLKPGGIFGVIDHTKRHNMPDNSEIWRREDPVLVIKEMIDAGFEFVDYSDLHYQENDQLIYDSTHKSIGRNSDRFTLKFRKPLD